MMLSEFIADYNGFLISHQVQCNFKNGCRHCTEINLQPEINGRARTFYQSIWRSTTSDGDKATCAGSLPLVEKKEAHGTCTNRFSKESVLSAMMNTKEN